MWMADDCLEANDYKKRTRTNNATLISPSLTGKLGWKIQIAFKSLKGFLVDYLHLFSLFHKGGPEQVNRRYYETLFESIQKWNYQ